MGKRRKLGASPAQSAGSKQRTIGSFFSPKQSDGDGGGGGASSSIKDVQRVRPRRPPCACVHVPVAAVLRDPALPSNLSSHLSHLSQVSFGSVQSKQLSLTLKQLDDELPQGGSNRAAFEASREALYTWACQRPAPYCSERYTNPFADRRTAGAGGQHGEQPFARLDRIRFATYTGRKDRVNTAIPRHTNLTVVLQDWVGAATATSTGMDLTPALAILEQSTAGRAVLAEACYAATTTTTTAAPPRRHCTAITMKAIGDRTGLDADAVQDAVDALVNAGLGEWVVCGSVCPRRWQPAAAAC